MKPASLIQQTTSHNRFWSIAFTVLVSMVAWCHWACSPPPPDNPVAKASALTPESQAVSTTIRDTAYMMNRLANPASMAVLHSSETVQFTSSHSRGEMFDVDVFQGTFEDDGRQWKVLFDGEGPGCINRIWLSGNVSGAIRIYFDDEEDARVDTTIDLLFNEKVAPFTNLFVYTSRTSGGGYVCYMPMPYEQRCRIAIDSAATGIQYQVQAIQWGDGVQTKTFSQEFDKRTQTAKKTLFNYIASTADQHFEDLNKRAGSVTIGPNGRQLIASLRGPGAIQYLQFTTQAYTVEVFQNLKLTMYWDSMVDPAVECTFAEFFNVVDANRGWSNPAYGYLPHKQILVTQFYMPYHEEAQIFIESTNPAPVPLNFEYRLALDEIDPNAMYFFAKPTKRLGNIAHTYPVFEFEGQGRYMGASVKMISTEYGDEKHYYYEGDDYVFIDGEPEATIQGTGLDQYINSYNRISSNSQFWVPTHGCRTKDDFEGGRSFNFRYQFLDSIPFQTSLLKLQEMGCPVQASASALPSDSKIQFEWMHYWYGKPTTLQAPRSEQVFHYTISQNETDAPDKDSPLVIGDLLYAKMQPGEWWIHYAPIWDRKQVSRMQRVIEGPSE